MGGGTICDREGKKKKKKGTKHYFKVGYYVGYIKLFALALYLNGLKFCD